MAIRKRTASTTPSSVSCVCRFELQHSGPGKVCVAGSFDDWRPDTTPTIDLGGGRWVKELTLPHGRHEYRFVVNGEWKDDPNAKEVALNPHGGINAVLIV